MSRYCPVIARSGATKQSRVVYAALDCFASLAMTDGGTRALSRDDFVADDDEFLQVHPPEARGERHVGGVAAGGHQDAADARMVVAGVERVPLARQIDLEPAREIHRRGIGRNADVAHIARAVARRNP